VIRTRAIADTSGIDAQIKLLDEHDKIVAAAGQRAYNRVAPEALAELRQEPPKARRPIEWTSDRQRKKVMILYRELGIKEWTRTHALSQAWIMRSVIDGKVFRIELENPSPIAKFVYGSMAKTRASALRFKQKFHTNTGWQDATTTGAKWTQAMIDEFRKEYRQEIKVRMRAYTGRTRRR
jgi:hypothetical protein